MRKLLFSLATLVSLQASAQYPVYIGSTGNQKDLDSVIKRIVGDSVKAGNDTLSSAYFAKTGTPSRVIVTKANRADSIHTVPGSYVPFTFQPSDTSLNVVYGGTTFKFKVNGGTTVAGDITEALSFSPVVGLGNSGGVWVGSAGTPGTYPNYGLATKKLASGQDGYVEFQFVSSSDGGDAMLAFSTTNTNKNYTGNAYETAVYIGSGTDVSVLGSGTWVGGTGTGGTWAGGAVVGNYYRMRRAGSSTVLETSTDHVSWSLLFTWSTTSTADFFININTDASKKVYYPKGFNLQ